MTEDDPEEYGTIYTTTALKSDTRLFISHHEGGRTIKDTIELFNDIESRRKLTSSIPIFTSDNWNAFEEGILNIYSTLVQPPYKGIGRKPCPIRIPFQSLKYAQVCKKRVKGRVVEVIQKVIFGDPEEVSQLLGAESGGKINTAYIERFNLTIRNSLARFIRKTMNFSKDLNMHTRAIDFLQAWYNFIKPHKSLRIRVNEGNRKWKKRTPAMAEGLTDHIWRLEELFEFRIPVQ